MSGGTVAIIPVRSMTGGKTRLAGTVDDEARAELTRLMLANVLRATGTARGVARVVIVSPDPAVHALGAEVLPTVEALVQPVNRPGLLPALEMGRSFAVESEASALLVVFGDLPRLATADIEALLAGGSAVSLAPDRHQVGTNALALRGAAVRTFPFLFGDRSFPAHRAATERMGATLAVVERPGLAFDLDTPGDLVDLPTTMAPHAAWRAAS